MKGTGPLLRRWRTPLAFAGLLVILQAANLRAALDYQRTEVLRGQVWRLLTGNLVHLGWVHLARDVVGLMLIWALFARTLGERSSLWVLLTSSLAVGVGLLAFSPGVAWYVGISGALFGLFCAGALTELPDHKLYAGMLLLGMAVAIGWAWHAGALPGETVGLGGQVVPQAHFYGALGGAMFILARRAFARLWPVPLT